MGWLPWQFDPLVKAPSMVLLSEPPASAPAAEAPLAETPAGEQPGDVRCSAVVARQFTLWPFGTRSVRLFLLLDPSNVDAELQQGLLRAMQQAYLRCETGSQTNAVRAAVLAVHYVLRHHNHHALPHQQVTASAAVAATRGRLAYVALVGEAAAFAWSGGILTGQRSTARGSRPLGLEHEPRLTLWSTPFHHGDRLVLVCGAAWRVGAADTMREILGASPTDVAERRLAEALAGPQGPARLLIDDGGRPHRSHPEPRAHHPVPPVRRTRTSTHTRAGWRRWLAPLLPLALLGAGAVVALAPTGQAQHLVLAQSAAGLLSQAQATDDVLTAHNLVTSARDAAQRALLAAPTEHAALVGEVNRALEQIDRVVAVQPGLVVRLGPTGIHVVDLAVGDDKLYTLDVVEGAVRAFGTAALDQQPTPESLVLRKGAAVGGGSLDEPVAIQYIPGSGPGAGALTVIDRQRTVVQLMRDGVLSKRVLPSSAGWQRLGALGASAEGDLFVLDSGSRRLLEYPKAAQKLVDPPRPVFSTPAPAITDFEGAAEVLALKDLYLRFDDGSVRRFDRDGTPLPFDVTPPEGGRITVAALAADRMGGLYLAEPGRARVLHVAADGQFIRQLRDPALGGLRALQSSADGQRLFGLVASGVLAFEVPELQP